MINGVMDIVAAVLFAVVFLSSDRGSIWLWIAGIYLAIGIGNLLIYAIRNHSRLRAAQKQAERSAREVGQTGRAVKEKTEEPQEADTSLISSE